MTDVPNPFEAPGAFYDHLAEHIRDPRFLFMNYGYADPAGSDDFAWLDATDEIWKYSLNLLRRLVDRVAIEGARVLDVGCGRGGNCRALARYFGAAEVIGLDASARAIASARLAVRDPRVQFVEGDALVLPFPDGRFDVVTNIESAQHYPDKRRFFAETHRVLRPSGTFCITDFSMVVAEVEALVAATGFEPIAFEDISHGAQAAVERCRADRIALLRDFVVQDTASRETIDWMIMALEGFDASEDVHYHRWILRKRG